MKKNVKLEELNINFATVSWIHKLYRWFKRIQLCSNKNYQQNFDEQLKERFFNAYKFSKHNNNKFILLLRKGIYPYEYFNDQEKFNQTLLPEKEDFYSHLNVEDITDTD